MNHDSFESLEQCKACISQQLASTLNNKRLNKNTFGYSRIRQTKGSLVNVSSFLASAILPGLLAIYATSLYSRHFTPAEYGRYSLALALAAPLLVLASQWLAQATTRFYHELVVQSEEHIIGQVISVANFFVLLFLVAAVIISFLSGIINIQNMSYCLSGLAYLITSIVLTNIASYMIYSGRHHIYNLTMTLSSFASFLFTLAFLYFTHLGISSLLFGTALSNTCSIIIFYCITKIKVFPMSISGESKAILRRFFNYGIPLSFWMLMYTIINISDRYILQYFLGSGEVGRYSIHYSLVALPFLAINSPIINIYSPKIMKAASENDHKMVVVYIKEATRVYVTIGLLAVGIAYRFGDSIPYIIIDRNYYIDKSFYTFIIAGFCIWNMSMFWHKPMEIAKNTKTMLYYISIAAFINVILNFILVPRYGINAAAITTLIAFCAYSLLVFVINRKNAGLVFDFKQLCICIFASFITICLSNLNPVSSIDTNHLYGAIAALSIFVIGYLAVYTAANYTYLAVCGKLRKGRNKDYA